jgi:hypothetical protein
MSRTVTALYDSRSEAESACERLTSTVETCSPRIIDQNSESGSGGDTEASMGSLYVSDEDRDAYGEGVRRGGFMLCAEVDSDADADQIVQLLEQTSAVDMDQRQQDWSNDGWQPGASSMGGQFGTGQSGESVGGSSDQSGLGSMRNSGTRQADRGGSSVRSYEWNSDSQSGSSGDQGGGMQSGQQGSSSFESDDQVSRNFQSDQGGGNGSR